MAKIKLKLIILHLINVRMSLDHHLTKVLADSHILPHYRIPGVFYSPGGGEGSKLHTHSTGLKHSYSVTDLLTMTMESLCGLSQDLRMYTYSRLAIGNWAYMYMYKKCKGITTIVQTCRLHVYVYLSNFMTDEYNDGRIIVSYGIIQN